MRLTLLAIGALLLAACDMQGDGTNDPEAQAFAQQVPLSDWAVTIMAAEWRDSNEQPIQSFENARHHLRQGFVEAGFNPNNITDVSLQPNGFNIPRGEDAFSAIANQTYNAQRGCLLYFTSHGTQEGLVIGDEGVIYPPQLRDRIDSWCGTRPTVVVVSACYSGVFLPELEAPNRMVMTASRADRSSFGCGAGEQYPYFDACVLEALPQVSDFIQLAERTRHCVSRREGEQGMSPPSEPQTAIGADMQRLLPYLPLNSGSS